MNIIYEGLTDGVTQIFANRFLSEKRLVFAANTRGIGKKRSHFAAKKMSREICENSISESQEADNWLDANYMSIFFE